MNDYYLYDQLINRLLNSYDPVSKRDMADYLNVKVKTVKRLKGKLQYQVVHFLKWRNQASVRCLNLIEVEEDSFGWRKIL